MPRTLFNGINHICVVTADLDRAVRTWADRYGVGPWQLWTKDASNMAAAVDGEPANFAMRVALCRLSASTRLELIQPLGGPSPYAASLDAHGGADHLHHVRLDVADYDGATARLAELGVHRLFEGRFVGAADTDGEFVGTYHDTTAELGFLVEIGHATDGFEMPAPESTIPADHQDSSTSPTAAKADSITRSGP